MMIKKIVWTVLNWLKWLLLPLGILHLGVVKLRNWFYDLGWIKTHKLPVLVVSVGNIQMGGSGKTPLVLALAKALTDREMSVGVVTRGYGRLSSEIRVLTTDDVPQSEDVGDEPAMMLRFLPKGAVMAVGKNRYLAGLALFARHPVDVILLDDGLQHRKLQRNMDICLIDVTRWHRHPFLFPFSYLRDAKSTLKRCDWLVLTRVEQMPEKAEALKQQFAAALQKPVSVAYYHVTKPQKLMDQTVVNIAPQTPVALLSGIANPHYFEFTVKTHGVDVLQHFIFADHYRFVREEIAECVIQAIEKGAEYVLVTDKDAVKIRELIDREADAEWAEKILTLPMVLHFDEIEKMAEQIVNKAEQHNYFPKVKKEIKS
jgi:tetraacyldisaccharide 4'-kinase